MAVRETKTCQKCGKIMSVANFYTARDGNKLDLCKSCLTMHVNNFEPETFTWILKRIDVPYVEVEWNKLRDKEFIKNPKKMTGTSVLGKYLSKMRLSQFKNCSWEDSDKLNEANRKAQEADAKSIKETKKRNDEQKDSLKKRYESGEISKAEYLTYMDTVKLNEDYQKKKQEEQQQVIDSMAAAIEEAEAPPKRKRGRPSKADIEARAKAIVASNGPQLSAEIMGTNNAYNENKFIAEEDMVDLGEDLTEEDKVFLAMKWGRYYTANEWVELERKYNEMKNSFDIQDSDTEGSLILVCKTYLKMNQAIDSSDMDGYQKLSKVYDSLRKSAKFTAAQNKEDKNDFIDSLGEMVAYCERDGKIPRFEIDTPRDVVDKVIMDMKEYNRSLIYEDTALSRQIEEYLKKREIADARARKEKSGDPTSDEITDKDYQDFFEEIEKQKNDDAGGLTS